MAKNQCYRIPDNYDIKPFKDKILFLKKTNHLNSKQFAEKCNIGQGTVSKFLTTDRNPDLITVWRIADAFDVSMDWLVDRDKKERTLPEQAALEFAKRYTFATADDRKIIDMILSKYED